MGWGRNNDFTNLTFLSLEILSTKTVTIFGLVVNKKTFKREEVLTDGRYRNHAHNSGQRNL